MSNDRSARQAAARGDRVLSLPMSHFDLHTARAVFDWLYVTLPLHEEAVAQAEPGLSERSVLDLAILRATAALDAEPTSELFIFLRWCVQRRRADEADEAARDLARRERRPVRIDAAGAVIPLVGDGRRSPRAR